MVAGADERLCAEHECDMYGGAFTDISVHSGGEADGLLLAAVDSFLQSVDHLLIRVDFIIEQHAVVSVSSIPENTETESIRTCRTTAGTTAVNATSLSVCCFSLFSLSKTNFPHSFHGISAEKHFFWFLIAHNHTHTFLLHHVDVGASLCRD